MSIWVFWKVFADVSLCFGVLAGFPTVFACSYSLLWPALLCAAGAGTAAFFRNTGKDPVRLLGLLLSAAALLIPANAAEAVIVIPAVLYTAAVILRGELALEYYAFRQYFKRTLTFLACFYLIMCALAYLDKPFDGVENFVPGAVLRYGTCHAIAGVALLRQLRLGEQAGAGRKMNAKQTAVLLGGTGALVLAIAAMEKWLRRSVMELLRTAFTAMFAPLLMVYNWFTSRGMDIVDGLTGKDPMRPQQSPNTPPGAIPMESVPPDTAVPEEPEQAFPWLVVAVLAVLVILMIVMLRSFRSRSTAPVKEETVEKLLPKQRRKRDRGTNRSRIRRIYRDFLKIQRKQGLKLRQHHTSADVQRKLTADTDPVAAEQLRQIYLAARYDENSGITAQQLSAAKAAYKTTNKK